MSERKGMKAAELFVKVFQDNWDSAFVTDILSDRTLSYKSFFLCALNAQEALKDLKITKGDIVCVVAQNSLYLPLLYFALLLRGAVVVPIDPEKGSEEVDAILSQLRYRCIIADDHIEKVRRSSGDVVPLSSLTNSLYRNDRDGDISLLSSLYDVDYEAPYMMTFTSGSTGIPKGVIHSCENFVQSSQAFAEKLHFGSQNIFYHNLPMTYMAGILNLIFLPFCSGSKVVIGDRFRVSEAMNFWEAPARYSVNTFWFVPTIISLLLKLDRREDGRAVASHSPMIGCVGTAPLLPRMKKEFEAKYSIPLFESYGLSEALFVTTEAPADKPRRDGVGGPLRGVDLRLSEDSEVDIGVPWMFLGYHNMDKNISMREGRFMSGDLGQLQSDNSLVIIGRKKNILIRGGINISPETIDAFVGRMDSVQDGVAVGIDDSVLGEKIVFFYTEKPGQEPNAEREMNDQIVARLGSSFRIDEFVRLKELPRTVNGKVDRQCLKALYAHKSYAPKD